MNYNLIASLNRTVVSYSSIFSAFRNSERPILSKFFPLVSPDQAIRAPLTVHIRIKVLSLWRHHLTFLFTSSLTGPSFIHKTQWAQTSADWCLRTRPGERLQSQSKCRTREISAGHSLSLQPVVRKEEPQIMKMSVNWLILWFQIFKKHLWPFFARSNVESVSYVLCPNNTFTQAQKKMTHLWLMSSPSVDTFCSHQH